MAFQSDIYIGWTGFTTIKSVFPEIEHVDLYTIDDMLYKEIPNDTIRTYLCNKYGLKITKEDMCEPYQSFYGPNNEQGIDECDVESFALGVNLTSRYYPTFLDFREPSGGLFMKRFDTNLYEDIEWFRQYLITNFDRRYANADIFVKDNHY